MNNLLLYDPSKFFGSRLAALVAHPVVRERIAIAATNGIALTVFAIAVFLLMRNNRTKSKTLRIVLTALAIISPVTKLVFGYSYDLPIALLSTAFDFLLLLGVMGWIGRTAARLLGLPRTDNPLVNIGAGTGITVALSLISVTLGLQSFIRPTYFVYIHAAVCLIAIRSIWSAPAPFEKQFSIWPIILLAAIPFIPYLFSAAPPDADVVSFGDILGFVLQGQNLSHVATGIPHEWFSIRYPAGSVGLGWFAGAVLGLSGSDILMQMWLLSFFIFVSGIVSLGKRIGIPAIMSAVLCINPVVTGSFGLHGGQVQEMMAYGLGLFAFKTLLGNLPVASGLMICAALVTHPIAAMPFALTIGGALMIKIIKRQLSIPKIASLACLGLSTILYLSDIARGPALELSQVIIVLKDWTPSIFVTDIVRHFRSDSLGLWYIVLAAIGYGIWRGRLSPHFALWLLSAWLLDGVFGDTRWAGRFQANFSTIGINLLAIGFLATAAIDYMKKRIGTFPSFATALIAWFLLIGGIGFPLRTESVFSSHGSVRLGKYLAANTPADALLANIRPPGDAGNTADGFGFLLGLNAHRNTLNHRISGHQAGRGQWGDRESIDACQKNRGIGYLQCLAKSGVSYAVVDARPQTKDWLAGLNVPTESEIGGAYIIRLFSRSSG